MSLGLGLRMLLKMFGLFNINKPAGITSHDVVFRVRKMLPRRVKVGHAGTLDPFASGVLVILVGGATRLASFVQTKDKRYLAGITLGAFSDTDDTESPPKPVASAHAPDENRVKEALSHFVGTIMQRPPAHSAISVGGFRAYKLAREGQALDLPPREVKIHTLDIVKYAYPSLTIDIRCGSGTYVRSLARDIGTELGVGGYCSSLTRTAVGDFTVENAVDLEDFVPERHLIDAREAVVGLNVVELDSAEVENIILGRWVSKEGVAPSEMSALLGPGGRLVAIGKVSEEGTVRPRMVLMKPGAAQ